MRFELQSGKAKECTAASRLAGDSSFGSDNMEMTLTLYEEQVRHVFVTSLLLRTGSFPLCESATTARWLSRNQIRPLRADAKWKCIPYHQDKLVQDRGN